jgi:hypothetical protein
VFKDYNIINAQYLIRNKVTPKSYNKSYKSDKKESLDNEFIKRFKYLSTELQYVIKIIIISFYD